MSARNAINPNAGCISGASTVCSVISLVATVLFIILNTTRAAEARFYLGTYTNDQTSKGIYTCTLDLDTGKLGPVELAAAAENPSYLALTPNGKFLYAASETDHRGLTVAFRVEPGGRLSLLNRQDSGGVGTCHVAVDASGHDTIATFAIGEDGRLTWIANAPARVKVPRGFAIDPTGTWLVAAGQMDNKIVVLKIDRATGKLSPTDQAALVGSPVCVLFSPPAAK